MNRRHFLKTCALATGAYSLSGCLNTGNGSPFQGPKTQPNIILVITDDQGYGDLSCHGNPVLKTPHLDALYAESLRLTNFHVSPTCAPTRSALMTGRHEFKNGVTHTILERERMSLASVTLPETLKKAGYTTGIFGKWHLGDEDAYQPENRGFDEVFIHGAGGIGQKYPGSCADAPPNQKNRYFDPVIKHNGTFVKTKGFCTDVFFRQSLGWINQQRQRKEPFFAYISTNAPHGPYIAPEKYTKRFIEQGLSKQKAGFYGMIENIDDNMAVLIEKLREWKMQEDTLLIFMTDNGSAAGWSAGMKGHKGTPHEGGTRVPAFFRWKGKIAQGVDVSRLTAHIDLFPTLAELAAASLPDNGQVEGRSLVPLLKDPEAAWEDRFIFIHVGRWKRGTDPDDSKYKSCAVRNERFRFVNNTELYDMQADPGQKANVIDQYPEVVEEMRAAYDTWWAETRPLMVNEDAAYEGIAPFIKNYEQQKKTIGIPDWTFPAI
jgi:arylsulfatase